MRPPDFPPNSDVADALLAYILAYGGKDGSLKSSDTYEPLADFFRLDEEQRNRPRTDGRGGSTAWQNAVQWARQKLINDGLLDGSFRGVWALTHNGRDRARRSREYMHFTSNR